MEQLLESVKKDKKQLLALKDFAMDFQHVELTLKLIDIEREYFPETEEIREIKNHARKISTAFGMLGLIINEKNSWLISETIRLYYRKKEEFSIKDSNILKKNIEKIFDN